MFALYPHRQTFILTAKPRCALDPRDEDSQYHICPLPAVCVMLYSHFVRVKLQAFGTLCPAGVCHATLRRARYAVPGLVAYGQTTSLSVRLIEDHPGACTIRICRGRDGQCTREGSLYALPDGRGSVRSRMWSSR